MMRAWKVWGVAAVVAALVLGVMGLVSWMALSLALERDAEVTRSVLEDNVRLALWRMDSALSVLLAKENARPPADYLHWPEELPGEDALPASLVLMHFELDGQASRIVHAGPSGAGRGGALDELVAKLPPTRAVPRPAAIAQRQLVLKEKAKKDDSSWGRKGELDFAARSKAVEQTSTSNFYPTKKQAEFKEPVQTRIHDARAPSSDTERVLVPHWIDGQLLLVRQATAEDGREVRQGVWLDWEALREWLLADVSELLPDARLKAVIDPNAAQPRMLASLPARLEARLLPPGDVPRPAPIWQVFGVAWFGLFLAGIAAVALLVGTLRLSERRAAFVSSVTHELRTPLTTFRMYTEMLSEGMVREEEQRRSYLDTLGREASRLSHLVENVLSFSRVEQGRKPPKPVAVELAPFLERQLPRLQERASQAGLTVALESEVKDLTVLAEPGGLEQVLFNLVDNATKYAAKAEDRRIQLTVTERGPRVLLRVRDHGPGIDPLARRDLFVPFAKSAHRAAESASGVGLGLALCRRLLRGMGGELRHEDPKGGGTAFTMELRRG